MEVDREYRGKYKINKSTVYTDYIKNEVVAENCEQIKSETFMFGFLWGETCIEFNTSHKGFGQAIYTHIETSP